MTTKQQFHEFFIQYTDTAHKLAESYIKEPEDAKDVVAESIEKALRNLNTLRDPNTMKSWFNKIVINTAIDFLRKQPKPIVTEMPSYYFDDFSHLNFEDLLEVLPERDRLIVSLRFLYNYALGEIAEELGMNENTVKTRLYRALKKLKLEITDDGNGVKVKARKKKNIAKHIAVSILVLILAAEAVFNLFPTLAYAVSDIPIIGDIVRVLTFNRFEFHDNGYNAEIKTPMIQGLLDPELEARLNAEFSAEAEALIIEFEQTYIELTADFGDEIIRYSLKSDYAVKTNDDRVLSLDTYTYSDVTGFELHKFYTIDKRTGTLVTLADLFKPSADYITPISNYIVTEMLRLNAEENATFQVGDSPFATFTEIKPDHNFYINENAQLVVCFDKYEVAAGFQGSPEFVIPLEVTADILTSDLIH